MSNIIVNLRLMAVDNCLSDDLEWYVEKSYRHYSRTYHTPLHLVREIIHPYEAIKIMMEDETVDLPVEELQEIKEKLVTVSKHKAWMGGGDLSSVSEEISDDEWLQMQNKILKEKEQSKPVEKAAAAASNLSNTLDSVLKKIGRDMESEIDNPMTFPKEGDK